MRIYFNAHVKCQVAPHVSSPHTKPRSSWKGKPQVIALCLGGTENKHSSQSCFIYDQNTKVARIKLRVKLNLATLCLPIFKYFSESVFSREEDITLETDVYFKSSRRHSTLPFSCSFL